MVRRVALVFGIVFLLIGILGLLSAGGMDMGAEPAPAMLLGLFPVNLLHNIVHLLFGVWGLIASRSFTGARAYGRIAGSIYIVLACLAFVSPSTFGLIPIGGNDVWLHAAIGLALAFVGFTARDDAVVAKPA